MDAKHTPGPWKAADIGDYDTDGIAVWGMNTAGCYYTIARVGYLGSADAAYAEANAQLIAAAPDMLEALRTAAAALDPDERHSMQDRAAAYAEVVEAFRKATGDTL